MVLASGLAVTAVVCSIALAGGWATLPGAGSVEGVILPQGTILHFPTDRNVPFPVPLGGAILVGAAFVDHQTVNLEALPAHSVVACPDIPANATYGGPSWWYSVNETLAPGQYYWGAICFDWGNVTITQPLELLYP